MGRFANPYPQFEDSTPTVYAGGKLNFYAAGTSTPQNTYTDAGLSSPNTNPVILNAAGRPPFDIFLQDLGYKVVLTDANNNPIWTADNYTARDSKLIAKTVTGSGSPNGSVAGTAGSSSILPDFYWDYTNLILYVCTTTGTSSTAVWTAINASTSGAVVPPPQGYLTLTTGVPIIPSDVTAATSVFYTPFNGNLVPIYNGSSFVPTTFTEQTLTLVSSHAASNIYDCFLFNNSGVPTIVTGPSWSAGTSGSITAGSCVRGTGTGGTALARVQGVLTNAVQITGRNGSTTYTIAANLATFLGSLYMDATNGQISCHRSNGVSRKWGVSNAYNREPITLSASDGTASWTNTPTTWQQSHASATNFATAFCCLAEEFVYANFTQSIAVTGTSTSNIGIGVNSTTSPSGQIGLAQAIGLTGGTGLAANAVANFEMAPALGINTINMIEQAPTGTTANTFKGTLANMQLSVTWRG